MAEFSSMMQKYPETKEKSINNREMYIAGMKKETYELLFKDENLPQISERNYANNKIIREIETFNMFDENTIKGKIIKKIFEKKYHIDFSAISYNKENKKYEYNSTDKIIPFEKLSDNISDKTMKRELLSNRRKGKCHEVIFKIIGCFENPAEVLTGTYGISGKRYLHSVIELKAETTNYIIDYTLNLIMPAENYMNLTQFKTIETITDLEMLNDEKEGINSFLKEINIYAKPYLSFRKEIKADLEKNKKMIKEVNDENINKRIIEIKKNREEFERE